MDSITKASARQLTERKPTAAKTYFFDNALCGRSFEDAESNYMEVSFLLLEEEEEEGYEIIVSLS